MYMVIGCQVRGACCSLLLCVESGYYGRTVTKMWSRYLGWLAWLWAYGNSSIAAIQCGVLFSMLSYSPCLMKYRRISIAVSRFSLSFVVFSLSSLVYLI